jgi:hypothetical protein
MGVPTRRECLPAKRDFLPLHATRKEKETSEKKYFKNHVGAIIRIKGGREGQTKPTSGHTNPHHYHPTYTGIHSAH